MSLYVRKIISKIYNYHVELLVVFIRNHCEFIFVCYSNESLMKKINCIYNVNVKTIVYDVDDVCLKRHKIIIRFNDFVEIANIDYDFVFSNRIFFDIWIVFQTTKIEKSKNVVSMIQLIFFSLCNLSNFLSIKSRFWDSTKYTRDDFDFVSKMIFIDIQFFLIC